MKVGGDNSLKKIKGDLRPSKQIIYRNVQLGALDYFFFPAPCTDCTPMIVEWNPTLQSLC